jgi:hemoglobin
MRTLWVCEVAGGPQRFVATEPGRMPLGLEEAHREFAITPAEFDEVAASCSAACERWGSRNRRRARCSPPSPSTRAR